tara:strand:+ start:369 stop:1292 length:924 start_codon:yes stop_codon:yes gene_type:complete
MATQTVEQVARLPEFQEQYLADLLTSAQGLFKPTSEGGLGLTMPYAPAQQAALSEGQQQAISSAMSGVGAYQPFLQQAQAGLTGAMDTAAGASMDPNAYKQYMDPYLEDVVQRAQADVGRQGQIQEQQAAAKAVGQGAFGGSRAAVLQGEIGRNTLEQQARTGERLRSAGFQQASNLAQQAAQQQLRQAQLGGALAQGVGALGGQAQAMGVQDINTLLGIGGLQQQQEQTGLNIGQQNVLAQQQLPFQQLGFLSDIFQGVPALQQTTSTTMTPPPSATSQLLGLGIAGLGAAGQAQGFGNLFNFGRS